MQKHCSIQILGIKRLLKATLKGIPLPMRLLIIMLCVSIGCIRATNTYAQNAILDLKVNNQTIETVLKIIESRTDFVFFFNSQQVNVHKRVSINVNKQNIFKILDEVFKGSDVVYSVLDKSIILSSKRFAPDGNLKKITGKVVDTNGEPLIAVTKLLQKSEMRKNMVMDLIYRGFIYAANYSESHYNPRRSQIKTELRYLFVTTPNR